MKVFSTSNCREVFNRIRIVLSMNSLSVTVIKGTDFRPERVDFRPKRAGFWLRALDVCA